MLADALGQSLGNHCQQFAGNGVGGESTTWPVWEARTGSRAVSWCRISPTRIRFERDTASKASWAREYSCFIQRLQPDAPQKIQDAPREQRVKASFRLFLPVPA